MILRGVIGLFRAVHEALSPSAAEEDERFVEKLDATGEGRHIANPDVVHRCAGGKGKRALEHAAGEGHAATEVEIAHQ